MNHTVYTIEVAYARMRELQELADRSRHHKPATRTGLRAMVRPFRARRSAPGA
ncbi:hypothetical protein [Streptomyces sp. URMC 123]|uniref:hypothetical protein n=1 Tax=Streptomyces sp. URMC 123 TaxID=3423403 RepID=UPI003F1AC0E7